jgi:hypothetical protein
LKQTGPPESISLFDKINLKKIGIIGAIGIVKGVHVIDDLSKLKSSKSDFNFCLIGYAYKPLKHIKVSGEYQEKEIIDLLRDNSIGMILLPGKWPETYSYTLSLALQTDIPIVAPNIGSFPERLSGRKNTMVYSYDISRHELFLRLSGFAEEVNTNNDVYASVYNGNSDSCVDFYECEYISIIEETTGMEGIEFLDVAQQKINLQENKNGFVKTSVRNILWRLSWSPYLRFIRSPQLNRLRSLVLKALS